jgi:hypothetical protein
MYICVRGIGLSSTILRLDFGIGQLVLMYPNIHGLLFLTFVVCRIPALLSIITGVAVSFNVLKPDPGIE